VSEDDAASGVEITAKLSDDGSGVNPDSVMMWLDGDPIDGDASVSNVSHTVKGLAYGEHTVRLVVADMLGNVADETWTFDVDDSTPPTVTVVSPKQDDVVGVQPMIKISYADAGSGVDLTSISVKVDDNPVMASAMAPADPAGAKVVSAGEASYEVRLGYGPHTLTVTVKDVAGNEATAEVNFVVEGDVLKVVKPHNYPNPFRGGETTITFGLSQQSEITIRIYDFTATLVATVAEEEVTQSSDEVKFTWDGTTDAGDGNSLANGVYFCKVLAKTDSETKYEIIKIALVRE
jgi:endonuclease YncB( thermonuclease family)